MKAKLSILAVYFLLPVLMGCLPFPTTADSSKSPTPVTYTPYATFTPVPTFTLTLTPPPLDPDLRITQISGSGQAIINIGLLGNLEETELPDGLFFDMYELDNDIEQQDFMWSLDSEILAFHADNQQGNHIFLLNWRSKDIELLDNSSYANPFWSSDGKELAFVRFVEEYFVLSIYERSTKEIRDVAHFPEGIRNLSWSPDGDWIAFLMDDEGQGNLGDQCFDPVYDCGTTSLYIIHPDGSQLTKLRDDAWRTTVYESFILPSWSHDGRWVAITAVENSEKRIVLTSLETGENIQIPLPPTLNIHSYPVWSPKDNFFLFEGDAGGNFQIYKLDIKDMQVTNLAPIELDSFSPSFSPDGEWIGFLTYNDEFPKNSFYIMSPDGSSIVKIADGNFRSFNSHSWFRIKNK